jgi:hypothetical protein
MHTIYLLSQIKTPGIEFIFISAVLTFIPLCALAAGWVAAKTGKSFRSWFWISFPVPFLPLFVLLCLPEKEETLIAAPKDDLYDYLY